LRGLSGAVIGEIGGGVPDIVTEGGGGGVGGSEGKRGWDGPGEGGAEGKGSGSLGEWKCSSSDASLSTLDPKPKVPGTCL
jgi:hypothetical protein